MKKTPQENQTASNLENHPKRQKPKQIAAWVCIIALLALYAATFLAAIFDTPGSGELFRTCLGATIVLPVLLWMYLWLYKRAKEREKAE